MVWIKRWMQNSAVSFVWGGKNNSRQTHLVLSSSDCVLVWVAVLAFLKWLNNFQQPRGAPQVREEYDGSLDSTKAHKLKLNELCKTMALSCPVTISVSLGV